METDLTSFIASQRRSLQNDKQDLASKISQTKSRESIARTQWYDIISAILRLSLNLGGYERKQKQLREERQNEYKNYLEQQNMRTYGEVTPSSNIFDDRNQFGLPYRTQLLISSENTPDIDRAEARHNYREEINKEYENLLSKKKSEERIHRVQFDDLEASTEKNRKKTIEFDSDEEELFNFVKREVKKKRRQSAEVTTRRDDLSAFKKAAVFDGRANSVPPKVPAIFGGDSQSSLIRERKRQYKKELEDQIKEREATKEREKLKRLGRITSAEFEKSQNTDRRMETSQNSNLPTPRKKSIDREAQVSSTALNQQSNNYQHQQHEVTNLPQQPPLNPYQMYLNQQQFAPVMAPVVNPQFVGWPQYQMVPPTVAPQVTGPTFNAVYNRQDTNRERKQWSKDITEKPVVPPLDFEETPRQKGTNSILKRTLLQPPGGKSNSLFKSSPSAEDLSAKKAQQKAYQEELKLQMELKRVKAEKDKAELEKQEMKLEREIAGYDPWGREGGGAPVRNQKGQVVANLRQLRKDSDQLNIEPFTETDPSPLMKAFEENNQALEQSKNAGTNRVNFTNSISNKDNSPSYKRGAALRELQGTGKSPRDLDEKEEYKRFLQMQVEEKKKKEEELKEKARIEEEKENKRLQEQQRRLQEEYEREQEKQKQKEEDLRRQNEALRLEAEKKRFEAEKQQKEIKEEQDRLLRKQAELKLQRKEERDGSNNLRTSSPPVPAVAKEKRRASLKEQKKDVMDGQLSERKPRDQNEANNNEMEYLKSIRKSLEQQDKVNKVNFENQQHLINQLTALRKQLQKQEVKVQTELELNKEKYKGLADKPKSSRAKKNGRNVFERAAKKTSGENINLNGSSFRDQAAYERYEFSSDEHQDLDQQQQEYLKQQELRLKALRENIRNNSPKLDLPTQRSRGSKHSLLESDSKFYSTDSNKEVTPRKINQRYNNSARSRRREKQKEQAGFSGVFEDFFSQLNQDTPSMSALQMEDIARKNEERLKQLKLSLDDEPSSDREDDQVLKSFMDKEPREGSKVS